MSARSIPNLRRDLPLSVVLLIVAVAAAYLPGAVAAAIAIASITALMLIRLTMLRAAGTRGVFRHRGDNPRHERTTHGGGSHAPFAA
jgi:hypothetical protein